MQIMRVEGMTRELGRAQGFIPLPVKDEFISTGNGDTEVHVMVTAWEPSPEELEKIKAGAPIHVSIYGVSMPKGTPAVEFLKRSGHPPIMLFTGNVPE